MLNALSTRLARSPVLRHLVFLAGAVAVILLSGYHFGTFDQVIHITSLKKYVDPALYPNDPMLELRFFHSSYFWFLFIPFYQLNILEPVMFVVHLAATYATFWMFWELSEALFHHPLTNLLAISALVFPHLGFPGFQIIEFSLLNRTFVLPFLLLAIVLYLRQKKVLAFLLLGILYNLHAISVNFVLAMFLLDGVFNLRKPGQWVTLLAGMGSFLACALPVLLWFTNRTAPDFSLRPDLLDIAVRAMMVNIYYIVAPSLPVILDTLTGASAFLFYLLSRRWYRSAQEQTMTHFFLAIGIILLVEVITTYLLPITLILQLQISRVGVFLQIFGYIYFAHYLAREFEAKTHSRFTWGVIAGAWVTYFSALLPAVFWSMRRWMDGSRWRPLSLLAALIFIQVGTVAVGVNQGYWANGIEIYGPSTPWESAQKWARENTPKDALFITPPQIYGEYLSDWRVFSERSAVVTIPELMELTFAPQFLADWSSRMEALAPGAIAKFNGNRADTFSFIRQAFYKHTPQEYLSIARRYHARYLVVEKPFVQPFPVVYENQGYVIYDLE